MNWLEHYLVRLKWALPIALLPVFYVLVQYFAMSSYNVFEVHGRFAPVAQVHFYSTNGLHALRKQPDVSSGVLPIAEQTLTMQLQNRLIKQFRFEVYHGGTDYQLERVALLSHFGSSVEIKGELAQMFSITRGANQDSYALARPLKQANIIIEHIIPLLMSVLVSVVLFNVRWRAFAPIKDLNDQQQFRLGSHSHFGALDGFRGVAALLVLLHHASLDGSVFKGVGDFGVWMFFVLSGFLLTKPFVERPELALDLAGISRYMNRRFLRIIPMFYFMVTIIFLLEGSYEVALRHYIFVQGDGHFWTILQEMYFYFILPFVALILMLICRGRPLLAAVLMLLAAWLWQQYAASLTLYGLNQQKPILFQVFFVGMAGAYFYHGVYKDSQIAQAIADSKLQVLHSVFAIVLLVAAIYASGRGQQFFGWNLRIAKAPLATALICLFLILSALVGGPKCWYRRLLSLSLLRYIGIIGYSFYLLHPYLIFMIQGAIDHFLAISYLTVSDSWVMVLSFIGTLVLASFTYAYIERPFLARAKS